MRLKASKVLLAMALGAGAAVPQALDAQSMAAQKKLMEDTCGACHDVGTATGIRRTRTDWETVVDTMAARGAQGSDKDFETITNYFVKTLGLVNVNEAPAKEIVEVLDIPEAAAEAIVKQRGSGYKDVAAVSKAAGTDLAAKKDRISFR